jgi:hypothetical protein
MTKTEQNRVSAWRLKLLHEASIMPRNVAAGPPSFRPVSQNLL